MKFIRIFSIFGPAVGMLLFLHPAQISRLNASTSADASAFAMVIHGGAGNYDHMPADQIEQRRAAMTMVIQGWHLDWRNP